MKYCPSCGKKLNPGEIEEHKVNLCECGYVDWDNWVNISAVSVCYNNQQEIMMVHLKRRHQGKLTFPGGFRNLGESLEEAAKRECYEESGHIIKDLRLYKVYTKDDERLIWVVYKAVIEEGNFIENDETEKVSFIPINQLPDESLLRGPLTRQLLMDLKMENK